MKRQTLKANKTATTSCVGSSNLSEAGWSTSQVILEARATIEPEEQELVMQLSPLYLEKIQAAELVGEARGEARGKAEGEAGLVLRLLNRRVGALSPQLLAQIQQLTVPQLEDLGEALLDFTSLADLEDWLSQARI